jgi:DNA-directed RNA polymerase specialized sigma24 family protein
LDTALTRLAEVSDRLSRIVECRFFGGMSIEETATALSVSDRTIRRDWIKAKAWLYGELRAG